MKPISTSALALLAVYFCASPAVGRAAATLAKPNVVFVIFDDLNDWVAGLKGHPQARTPNLERLMRRGVTFTNAHCNAPLCAPSRPSMLTGLYPHTARFFGGDEEAGGKENWSSTPVYKDAKTWVQHFKENGYDVYGTGKIYHQQQMRWSDFTNADGTRNYGAAQNYGPYPTDGTASAKNPAALEMQRYPGQEYRSVHGFYASLADVPKFSDAAVTKKGKAGAKKIGPAGWMLAGQPFRYVNDDDRDLMPDEQSAAYAVTIIAQPGRTKPYLLNIGFHRPHLPLTAPQKFYDQFPTQTLRLADIKPDDLDDVTSALVYTKPGTKIGGFLKYEQIVQHGMLPGFTRAYLAGVAFADAQLGLVLDAIDRSPEAASTTVVVTSDHGFHLGEKSYFFKNTLWEESTRIPLVIAGPGIARGARVSAPVSLVDLYPTLIDVAALPAQPHPHRKLDGHSLASLLKDPQKGKWSGPAVALTVIMNPASSDETDPARQPYAVRSARYRYILCPGGEEELYDHESDPNEWTNLAVSPAHATTKRQLRGEMEKLVGVPLGGATGGTRR